MNRDALLTIVKFNAQSNRLALNAAAGLTSEELFAQSSPSHGTVFELLKHMYGGERVYLDFCQGYPFDPAPSRRLPNSPTCTSSGSSWAKRSSTSCPGWTISL